MTKCENVEKPAEANVFFYKRDLVLFNLVFPLVVFDLPIYKFVKKMTTSQFYYIAVCAIEYEFGIIPLARGGLGTQ